MADVYQKCITANNIKNNSVISTVSKNGVIQSKQRGKNELTDLDAKLTDRFDDVSYYNN